MKSSIRIDKVTTKSGDFGLTLLNGKKVSKTHPTIILLGDLDELNCILGLTNKNVLQNELFFIGAAIYKEEDIDYSYVDNLEKLRVQTKPIDSFVLPRNFMHLARAVCRRVERQTYLANTKPNISIYFNRLSDILFTLARNEKDVLWSYQ